MTDATEPPAGNEPTDIVAPSDRPVRPPPTFNSLLPQRYKLTLAYRGTQYHGWQTQSVTSTFRGPMPPPGEGLPTIQTILSRTLRGVVNHPVIVIGSSRTDAGVHAEGQVCQFDTDKTQIPLDGLRRAINARLPDDILVRSIEPVPRDFDVIAWTTSKRYEYTIWHDLDRPVMAPDLSWHRWKPMDVPAMVIAAAHLVGTHDFASFARPGHKRANTVRTLLECGVSYDRPRLTIGVTGTGFLWNMVRIIVGTLVDVGLGRFAPDDVPMMLAARDRRAAGGTAPPHGLCLQWIKHRGGESDTRPVASEATFTRPEDGSRRLPAGPP